jgi:hypothetical protein
VVRESSWWWWWFLWVMFRYRRDGREGHVRA